MLDAAIAAIDAINANDPKSIPDDSGRPAPFRLQYSKWLTAWVQRLDPNAMDELLILARGKRCAAAAVLLWRWRARARRERGGRACVQTTSACRNPNHRIDDAAPPSTSNLLTNTTKLNTQHHKTASSRGSLPGSSATTTRPTPAARRSGSLTASAGSRGG